MRVSKLSFDQEQLDPVVVHARREAAVILVAFAVCLGWSVTWCYLAGYHQPGEAGPATVLGMPSWVFWGVLVPWVGADLFACWFCFCFMADDPLGEAPDETANTEAPTEAREPSEEGRHG